MGQRLGVGRILEGSLQRAADRVRVNAQLIDARSDTHLWAKTYDRTLDDAFTVESEIADAVAAQLNANLAQKINSKRPTQNVAAYNAYLRGLGIEHAQANISSAQQAAAAYAEAVQLDPNFALAWARLGLVRSRLYTGGVDRNANSATTVKEAAERAIELRPDLGEAWLAQGQYRAAVLRDWAAALQAYREAEKYLRNSALVNEYLSIAERRLGHWREAVTHLEKAIELDPRNVRFLVNTAQEVYSPIDRYTEAHAALDRALEISPNNDEAIAAKADLFQQEGRLDEAAKELARLPKDSTNPYVINLRAWQAMRERKFDVAVFWTEQATKRLKPGEPLTVLDIWILVHQGYFQEWAGHPDEARATFERIIHELTPTPGSVIPSGRETRSYLALAYAGLGEKDKALEQARQAVADYEGDTYSKPYAERCLAMVQARCGEVDAAIDTLRHLVGTPDGPEVPNLRSSPFWDPLRKDPKFQALLKNPTPVRY